MYIFVMHRQLIRSVVALISHGADINVRTDHRSEERSVLHYAVMAGCGPIVELLIRQGMFFIIIAV